METIQLSYPFSLQDSPPPTVLAIGYFDGVHLGHQAVIDRAKSLAERLGAAVGVMTFHPHPREVLGKGDISHYLTPFQEKREIFERLGVDRTYVIRFDREFASLSKESFVENVLMPLNVKGIAVGFNFSFAKGAEGTAEDLVDLGQGRFEVEITPPIYRDEIPLSSTRIREALSEGRIEMAREILGRPYTFQGKVVHGDHRGRKIGFPTANLLVEEAYFPLDTGVYVVKAFWKENERYGVMNVGYRPTFHDAAVLPTMEVHLMDTNEDLYGLNMEVSVLHRLRSERKFSSIDALVDQIRKDEKEARSWLKSKGLT